MQTPSRGGASFCCFSAGTFSDRCPCWWGSSGTCSMFCGRAEQSAGSSSPDSQSWLPCVCTKHLEGNPGWEWDCSSSPSPPFQPAPCSERKPSTGAAPALQPDALSIPIFINLYFWGGSCPVGREKMSRSYFLAHGCLWRYLFVGMGGVWGYFPICFLLRLYQGAVLRAWAE